MSLDNEPIGSQHSNALIPHNIQQNISTSASMIRSLANNWCVRKRNLFAHLSIWAINSIVLVLALTLFPGTYIGFIFLILALSFILLFQTSYKRWASFIRTFCSLLTSYSILVSIVTYSYQFEPVRNFYERFLSQQLIIDIGLQNNDAARMFIESFFPLVLTILITLYLRLFQLDFTRLAYLAAEDDVSLFIPLTGNNRRLVGQQQTSCQRYDDSATAINMVTNSISGAIDQSDEVAEQAFIEQPNTTRKVDHSNQTLSPQNTAISNKLSIQGAMDKTIEIFWRFLEVHYVKFVAFMTFRLAITDICLLNFPLILLVIVMLKSRYYSKCACLSASCLISLIISARMVFDLPSLSHPMLVETCENAAPVPEVLRGKEFSFLDYVGLSLNSESTHNHIMHHLFILILITLKTFVQLHYENRSTKSKEFSLGVIFEGIGRREADKNMVNTVMYFFNFGFYEFGVEVTCLFLVIVISHRLDVVGLIYGICLLLTSMVTSRKHLSTIWPIITFLVILLVPFQYILRLGLPKALCMPYIWENLAPDQKNWLYLPVYHDPADPAKSLEFTYQMRLLLFDFLVLLAVCSQSKIFKHSKTLQSPSTDNNGSHHNLSANEFRIKYLPTYEEFRPADCFSGSPTNDKYFKSIFFNSIYWITLATVLIAVTNNFSLFSLGYLIGCFVFLWLGNDSYLAQPYKLLRNWNCLILYSVLVINIKVVIQYFACTSSINPTYCSVFRLVRVVCRSKVNIVVNDCKVKDPDNFGILWDGLCLMFLLLQRVVFGTQYFRYLVKEVKAQQILASRGAELIRETQIEEAKAQDVYDKRVMNAIREKMENLKSENEESAKVWKALLNLPHHHQIIRNADKHLFNSYDDRPVSQVKQDSWKMKKAFIPDPSGDELERIDEINGLSAVFTRWMKGQSPYGSTSNCNTKLSQSNSDNPSQPSRQATERARSLDTPPTVDSKATNDQEEFTETTPQIASTSAQSATLQPEASESCDIIEESETVCCDTRVKTVWEYINLIFYSILLSATVHLNRFSRSYRYVSRRLRAEKSTLRQHYDINDVRFKSDLAWKKSVIKNISETYTKEQSAFPKLRRIKSSARAISKSQLTSFDLKQQDLGSVHSFATSGCSTSNLLTYDNQPVVNGAKQEHDPINKTSSRSLDEPDQEILFLKLNMFTQFCRALFYVLISNTSLACQILVVVNQLVNGSLVSLPLPLLTFLWGNLSVPRPTKRFWKTVITYTELSIVFKYIIQFWDIDNNQTADLSQFNPPNLLGIRNINIVYDLVLLTSLFFHRSMLKSLGQWDASMEDFGGKEDQSYSESINYNDNDSSDNIDHQKAIATASLSIAGDAILYQPSTSASTENLQRRQIPANKKDLIGGSQTLPTVKTDIRPDIKSKSKSFENNLYHNRSTATYQHYEQFPFATNSTNLVEYNQNDLQTTSKCCKCCGIDRFFTRCINSICVFFDHVLNTPYKVQTDVYTWMFSLDFVNFLILIYGFWAFGGGYTNQTVASFLNENRIPSSVLFMLLLQFASIIIDRALYLRKNLEVKLLFHVFLVIAIHVWIFFLLPLTTGRAFNLDDSWPPKAWYVFKCTYFLFSAYQIRSGYPRRVLGNCLTKNFGYFNWYGFKVYRAIPLVYDLRLYMDWIFTETTLEFRNWSIMEDMFSNLFIRKCELTIEEEYPYERAKPIGNISKWITGGSFLLLILAIIWGPLLLFSMGKTVGQPNQPLEFQYDLEFVGFQPLLKMRATRQSIKILNESEYQSLKEEYPYSNYFQTFLNDYRVGDVAQVYLNGESDSIWEISPPSRALLIKQLIVNTTDTANITLKSSWTIQREKQQKSQNIDINISGSYQVEINTSSIFDGFRKNLVDMLKDPSTSSTPIAGQKKATTQLGIFPTLIKVPVTGEASLVDSNLGVPTLTNITLSLIRDDSPTANVSWWTASLPSINSPDGNSTLKITTFNDRVFTGFLAVLSAPGIIGLYTTFVVFFARLIRTDPSSKVIYTEIPMTDRVYALMLDIYMMRESKEFELEEKLFAKLLFLYRSPEMLIEWSRRDEIQTIVQEPQQPASN